MNKIQKTNWQVLTALALSLMAVNGVQAADITWGSPTDVSGDTDVSTAGSLIYAYNLGGYFSGQAFDLNPATVNSVLFEPFAAPYQNTSAATNGVSLNIGTGGSFYSANGLAASGQAPFANLSPDYQVLLGSGVSTLFDNDVLTLTLEGLTPGQSYALQLWSNDSGRLTTRQAGTTYEAGNAVTLDNNASFGNSAGGVGQWVIGNFTANAATQVITIQSSNPSLDGLAINAFQLRAEPAPEPGTLAVLVLGAATIAGYGWRRRRVAQG